MSFPHNGEVDDADDPDDPARVSFYVDVDDACRAVLNQTSE